MCIYTVGEALRRAHLQLQLQLHIHLPYTVHAEYISVPNSHGLITAQSWPESAAERRAVVAFNDSSVRCSGNHWPIALALNIVANNKGHRAGDLLMTSWLGQAGHSSMDSISVAATAKSTAQLANDEPAPRAASLPQQLLNYCEFIVFNCEIAVE